MSNRIKILDLNIPNLELVEFLNVNMMHTVNKEIFNWLKNKEPYAIIGHTLFIYDITSDWISHKYFGIMYLSRDLNDKARREFKRALAIKPSDTQSRQYLERI